MNIGRNGGACHCVQCDDKCIEIRCQCEGGDGYSEDPFKCAICTRRDELIEDGKKPLEEKHLKECPLCGEPAIVWIDPKLSNRIPPTDFFSVGCVDVGGCGVELVGWLNKADMIKHWNKRAK